MLRLFLTPSQSSASIIKALESAALEGQLQLVTFVNFGLGGACATIRLE